MSENMNNDVSNNQLQSSSISETQNNKVFTFKATQFIWLILGILEALLGLRVFLKMIGANPGNPFATFLYKITDLFVLPFSGLTATPAIGNMVFEVSTIIAMIVYGLIGWAAERLVWLLFYKPATK